MDKRICIIHSGGTIGMMRTDKGYAPKKGYLAQILRDCTALRSEQFPTYDLKELSAIYDSSDVAVAQWNEIGALIDQYYDCYDGFVILHGTDTMAYTASALSFMLEGLDKAVILTGSQIPFCEARNDAQDNLINSLLLACDERIKEVCLCFGGQLFRGNRATKISAQDFVAFASPNYPVLAQCGVTMTVAEKYLRTNNACFSFTPFDNYAIAVLKVFPGIQFGIFSDIVTKDLGGLVLEAFGSGNIPSEGGNGLSLLLKRASDSKTPTVIVTQCLQGSVSLGLYKASSALVEYGAICGYDLTPESAVTKLYYLLSKHFSGAQLAQYMVTDLRGEITV